MNLNDDVVYRCLRLGPLYQLHPGRSRSLVRHNDCLHDISPRSAVIVVISVLIFGGVNQMQAQPNRHQRKERRIGSRQIRMPSVAKVELGMALVGAGKRTEQSPERPWMQWQH